MTSPHLQYHAQPHLQDARMILGFSGWMDGGDVSTGTVEYLVDQLDARPLASIESEDFYIYNFPGSMELSALFRPHVKIEDGLVSAFDPPTNTFHYCEDEDLILFEGKEPNVKWSEFADCLFEVARLANVNVIYFVGSVAGLVPHTREPRLFTTVSHRRLKEVYAQHGLGFTSYEGPGSLISYLLTLADRAGFEMATVVAEIPAYVQGRNVKCIQAMLRKLAAILDLQIDHDELRLMSDELEKRITETVEERPELADHIRKLEEDYDNEVFDTQMGDLKRWLQQQGIRLD